jgi:hypothetical protein
MAPELIAAIISVIPSLIKGISGAAQSNTANKIESQNARPLESVMPAIKEMMGNLKGEANAYDIPGGGIARNQIAGATAAGMNTASRMSSGAEGIGAADKMVAEGQKAQAALGGQTQQYVAGKQSEYNNALGSVLAPEQQRVDYWNRQQKYLTAQQIAQQLRTVGPQNMYSGLSGVAGTLASAESPDFNSMLSSGKSYGGSNKSSLSDADKAWIQELLNPGRSGPTTNETYTG